MTASDVLQSADTALRVLTWAGLIIACRGLTAGALQRIRAAGWKRVALPVLVFAAALLPRWLLPPWAPLHAADIGIEEIYGFMHGRCGSGPLYGAGYCQLVALLTRGFPSEFVVFAFATLCGSLSCVALYFFARTLSGSTAGAFVAAMGLA